MNEIKNLKLDTETREAKIIILESSFYVRVYMNFLGGEDPSLGFSSSALKTWAGSLVKIVKSKIEK